MLFTRGMSTQNRVFSCSGLVLVAALSATGCYARAGARVDVYPSYYYEGRTVYLIDGHWYYRQPTGRWVYYREEPPVLYRQRVAVHQAPPARPTVHREAPPRQAPPATYRDDGRRVAPPPATPPKRRHDDRDHRDHDGRERDGHRHDADDHDGRDHDDHDHDHHDRDRY